MYILASKFRFLEFRLLLSRVAPYLQFVTTNCLISAWLILSFIFLYFFFIWIESGTFLLTIMQYFLIVLTNKCVSVHQERIGADHSWWKLPTLRSCYSKVGPAKTKSWKIKPIMVTNNILILKKVTFVFHDYLYLYIYILILCTHS